MIDFRFQIGPHYWVSPSPRSSSRYPQDGVSHTQWPLRIYGHAIRPLQCTVYFPITHEFGVSNSLAQIRHCLFDNILVYSRNWDEHLQHVRVVLELLRKHQLFVKLKKCKFGRVELDYLGHIISDEGVKIDQTKIEAMLSWPAPTTVTELRGFLGLTGYYRKFVKDYRVIARPLTNLLKKNKFEWSGSAEVAFQSLKSAMTSTPTLALPDFTVSFIIQSDASGDGIGVVLTQNDRLVVFMSRSLGVTNRNWSTYAREMLAIVIAIRTWRLYLLGHRFTIQTYQKVCVSC